MGSRPKVGVDFQGGPQISWSASSAGWRTGHPAESRVNPRCCGRLTPAVLAGAGGRCDPGCLWPHSFHKKEGQPGKVPRAGGVNLGQPRVCAECLPLPPQARPLPLSDLPAEDGVEDGRSACVFLRPRPMGSPWAAVSFLLRQQLLVTALCTRLSASRLQ